MTDRQVNDNVITFPAATGGREIGLFFHCKQCGKEIDSGEAGDGVSPCTYSQLEVGWTEKGLQVWCRRHDLNIIHIDFEGAVHSAI